MKGQCLWVLLFFVFSVDTFAKDGFIYWTDVDTEKVHRANLDGSNVQDLVTLQFACAQGIALEEVNAKMYWVDWCNDTIERANLDGSNVEILVRELDQPQYIALDVTGGKMYWTTSRWTSGGQLQRANLDGSNVETLVTEAGEPSGIALDVEGGKVYWINQELDKLQRANLDGSNAETLVTELRCPEGIALDVEGGKVYWTDWCSDKIQRANLDGSDVQDVVALGIDWGRGIALTVADGKMYWIGSDDLFNPGTGSIHSANLDGSNVQTLVTGLGDPRGITVGGASQAVIETVREDVNRDGVVDVQDIVYVAQRYGQTGQSTADVNKDNVVNLIDIVLVAATVSDVPAAPAARLHMSEGLTSTTVNRWLTAAKLMQNKTPAFQRGILMLEQLLVTLTPDATALLSNYPNPFNPETWIPYHLAADADVQLTIYDTTGAMVRRFDVGHRVAGYYTDRARAVYWDGRNGVGESVGSGVYFYHLRAGDYSQTRRMVILK